MVAPPVTARYPLLQSEKPRQLHSPTPIGSQLRTLLTDAARPDYSLGRMMPSNGRRVAYLDFSSGRTMPSNATIDRNAPLVVTLKMIPVSTVSV